jgi:hypothetical protein
MCQCCVENLDDGSHVPLGLDILLYDGGSLISLDVPDSSMCSVLFNTIVSACSSVQSISRAYIFMVTSGHLLLGYYQRMKNNFQLKAILITSYSIYFPTQLDFVLNSHCTITQDATFLEWSCLPSKKKKINVLPFISGPMFRALNMTKIHFDLLI